MSSGCPRARSGAMVAQQRASRGPVAEGLAGAVGLSQRASTAHRPLQGAVGAEFGGKILFAVLVPVRASPVLPLVSCEGVWL